MSFVPIGSTGKNMRSTSHSASIPQSISESLTSAPSQKLPLVRRAILGGTALNLALFASGSAQHALAASTNVNPQSQYLNTSASRANVVTQLAQSDSEVPTEPPPPEGSDESTPTSAESTSSEPKNEWSDQKVFVAGATGRTGKFVVEQLLAKGVPVVAFVRDYAKAESKLPITNPLLTVSVGDVGEFESIRSAMKGCTSLVNVSGTNSFVNLTSPYFVEFKGAQNITAAAKLEGLTKQVIVTTIGTDELLSPFNLFGGLAFFKRLAEEEMERSGIDYTIVRPGGLQETNDGEKPILMKRRGTFGFGGDVEKPEGPILRKQVAEVCVASIVDKGASNKIVEVVTAPGGAQRSLSEWFQSV